MLPPTLNQPQPPTLNHTAPHSRHKAPPPLPPARHRHRSTVATPTTTTTTTTSNFETSTLQPPQPYTTAANHPNTTPSPITTHQYTNICHLTAAATNTIATTTTLAPTLWSKLTRPRWPPSPRPPPPLPPPARSRGGGDRRPRGARPRRWRGEGLPRPRPRLHPPPHLRRLRPFRVRGGRSCQEIGSRHNRKSSLATCAAPTLPFSCIGFLDI